MGELAVGELESDVNRTLLWDLEGTLIPELCFCFALRELESE